jgi:hypothetical protein
MGFKGRLEGMKALRIVRRGPMHWYLEMRMPDGSELPVRLAPYRLFRVDPPR